MNLTTLKDKLRNTWLFPRYIDRVYMHRAIAAGRDCARGRMLDVGCGMRQYEYIFANVVRKYVGIDWPMSADQAKADVIADALAIPFADRSFDCVLTTEVIEHVPDPETLLREIARVMRVGGALIMSAPFIGALHEEPRDYYRFTPYSLDLLLKRQGFSIKRLSPRGGWWTVVLAAFVVPSLYDMVNPPDEWVPGASVEAERDYGAYRRSYRNVIGMALVLPICALLQMLAYVMDRLFKSARYTLGYVLVATRGET